MAWEALDVENLLADELIEEEVEEEDYVGDVEGIVRQTSTYSKLSADSWVTVESEYDAQGENLFFLTVEDEKEEKKQSAALSVSQSAMAKASNVEGKSVLDCVVELLRGTRAQKKKSLLRRPTEKWIWLWEDLATLMWKSKKRPDISGKINLTKCRVLRSTDKDIIFQLDQRRKYTLTLSSPAEVRLWITGLSCLVPRDTKVLMGNEELKERLNYDPIKDAWRGKLISTRKHVNEYILLGGKRTIPYFTTSIDCDENVREDLLNFFYRVFCFISKLAVDMDEGIGRGAFGKVKLAISTVDKRFYAVKIMTKQKKGSFLSEANKEEHAILRKLRHRNIVKHRDVLFDPSSDKIVLVVEYMARGVVLDSSKLEGVKPLSEEGVREIMRDVVSGLLYLHSQRVVHRDIKPDNLLRAGDGTVKLGDFGEARMYDVAAPDNRSKPTSPGTPVFLAPEFCMSDKSFKPPVENYAADVWSLGATIYYMVFGRAPFIASSVFELYDVICKEDLKFPKQPHVSRALKDLLKAMLTKDPLRRATLNQVANDPWFETPIKMQEAERIKVTEADIKNAIRKATWVIPDNDG